MKAKRKLSDLKENECIKVITLKEAKYFIKVTGWIINPKELINKYVTLNPNGSSKRIFIWCEPSNGIGIPASDFIKPKKSKVKKLSKKVDYLIDFVSNMQPKAQFEEVYQEIAHMDSRISDLESSVVSKMESTELKETPKEEIKTASDEINWKKAGQLVTPTDGEGNAVLMTTGFYSNSGFGGITLIPDSICDKAGIYAVWDDKDFKLYNGEIFIKNE